MGKPVFCICLWALLMGVSSMDRRFRASIGVGAGARNAPFKAGCFPPAFLPRLLLLSDGCHGIGACPKPVVHRIERIAGLGGNFDGFP